MPRSLAHAGAFAALTVTVGTALWVQAVNLPSVTEQAPAVLSRTQRPQAAQRLAAPEVESAPTAPSLARESLELCEWEPHLPTPEEVLSDLGVVKCEDRIVAFADVEVRQHGRTTRFKSGHDGRIRGVVDWNAQGVVEVSDGSWRTSAEIAALPCDFELQPPLTLVINVKSAREKALAGAELRLLKAVEGDKVHLPLAHAGLLARGVTDAQGVCGWQNVAPGMTYLEIRHPEHLPALVAVHLRGSGRDREIHLWQNLANRLRDVRILDEKGQAVADARVLVGGLYEEGVTDGRGYAPIGLPWGWMRGTAFELTRELWIRLPSGKWWCPDSSEARCFSLKDGRLEIRTQDRSLRAQWAQERKPAAKRVWVAVAPGSARCAFPSQQLEAVGSPAFLGIGWQALDPGCQLDFAAGWTGSNTVLMGIDNEGRLQQRTHDSFHNGVAEARTWSGTYSCVGDTVPPESGSHRTPPPPSSSSAWPKQPARP